MAEISFSTEEPSPAAPVTLRFRGSDTATAVAGAAAGNSFGGSGITFAASFMGFSGFGLTGHPRGGISLLSSKNGLLEVFGVGAEADRTERQLGFSTSPHPRCSGTLPLHRRSPLLDAWLSTGVAHALTGRQHKELI